MREHKLADLSMLFAVNALNLANSVEGHYSLKNQFERSATSIGAKFNRKRSFRLHPRSGLHHSVTSSQNLFWDFI